MRRHPEETPNQLGAAELTTRTVDQDARRSRARRGRSRFTQADVTRAIRAAQVAKVEIAAVRIEPDGSILIVLGTPPSVASLEENEWDD